MDKTDGHTVAVDGAEPHRIAGSAAALPLLRFRRIDNGCQRLDHRLAQERRRIGVHIGGIGDMAVAHGKGLLGRLDQQMHKIEAISLGAIKMFEGAEYQQ